MAASFAVGVELRADRGAYALSECNNRLFAICLIGLQNISNQYSQLLAIGLRILVDEIIQGWLALTYQTVTPLLGQRGRGIASLSAHGVQLPTNGLSIAIAQFSPHKTQRSVLCGRALDFPRLENNVLQGLWQLKPVELFDRAIAECSGQLRKVSFRFFARLTEVATRSEIAIVQGAFSFVRQISRQIAHGLLLARPTYRCLMGPLSLDWPNGTFVSAIVLFSLRYTKLQ